MQLEVELTTDTRKLLADLDVFELRTFLSGPHDKNNCIFTINAGAGGTEAQDWAEMLSRMYGRWFDSRGWKWEVTDALEGDSSKARLQTLLQDKDEHVRAAARKVLDAMQPAKGPP